MKTSLFGELLRQWRSETLELSLSGFARKLSDCGFEYSVSVLARYERGERKPGGEFLAHLSLCFNLSEERALLWLRALGIEYVRDLVDGYSKTISSQGRKRKP